MAPKAEVDDFPLGRFVAQGVDQLANDPVDIRLVELECRERVGICDRSFVSGV